MNDINKANMRGRVKLELYNEDGVYFTKEKQNLIVLGANKILGKIMSDPARKTTALQTDKGSTALAVNAKGYYEMALTHANESEGTYTIDVGSANTSKEITIPNVSEILYLIGVKADNVDLVLRKDVSIKNPDTGVVKFKVAPKNSVSITFRQVKSKYVEIMAGTEVVTVGGEAYTLSDVPSEADKTYAIDYKAGRIYFAAAKTNVKVDYTIKLFFSLGFMGLGGKPANHPIGIPVSFAKTDKLKTSMDGEFPNSRQLIQYPAVVTTSDPEIEVFPTKSIAYTEKLKTITGDGTTKDFTLGATNKVLSIVSAKLDSDATDVATTLVVDKVRFTTAPATGVKVNVRFREQLDNNHLIFEMSDAPVLELISVKHQALDNTVKQYSIVNRGLTLGQGDVWLMNSAKGLIQFSATPKGVDPNDATKVPPLPETAGQFTFEYRVNGGTSVHFVADFPKGVPGPIVLQTDETISISAAVTSYNLSKTVFKGTDGVFVADVFLNGTKRTVGTDYDISTDGKQIVFKIALKDTDSASVTYKYTQTTHEVYQVAMYTEQVDGDMFNISGIGPVTKDENTGMRVTWTVTF